MENLNTVINTVFQSTHPVRGATNGQTYANAQQAISIHAPREGCDVEKRWLMALT